MRIGKLDISINWKRFLTFLFVLILILAFLDLAKAETGSITLVDSSRFGWAHTGGGGVHNFNGTFIHILNTSYNSVSKITLTIDSSVSFSD